MRIRFIAVAVFLALAQISSLAAQVSQKAPTAPGTVIGPNDGITIVALGADDISKTWRVSSTGELTLPMVGKIYVAGMTTEQVEQELTTRLKLFILDPQVTIYISEFRSETVTVEGAVEKPGRIQTEGQKTLLGVLMMAGGTKSPGPTVKVTRASEFGIIPLPGVRKDLAGLYSTVELPVKDALDASSAAANLIMEPDDVVSVSMQQRLVYIMGEVNRPGAIELVTQDSISIVQVLAVAGGMTKIASPSKTTILRRDSEGRYDPAGSVDLKKILTGKHEDKLLIAGDIIVVPSSNVKFYLQAITMSAATSGVTSGLFILTRY
jgi:polysaccharide export outer membrane protein